MNSVLYQQINTENVRTAVHELNLKTINPQFLHSNSTSHTWPFSAVAELIDNAYDPDVSAKQIWIDKTMVKDQDCLIFMDNGNGMKFDMMHKMLSFGFSEKQTVRDHVPVGLYGNGFKSGSMRLGKDAIVFSKKPNTMCVGLLSQTYLKDIEAQNVIVPIVEFTNTGQTVNAKPEHEESLHDILKYSLFNTKEELLSELNAIDSLCTKSHGTRIIIWNLHRTSSGELEFDFQKNRYDIRLPVDVYTSNRETRKRQAAGGMSVPESEYSLRAYCTILYLKPRMEIVLQGKRVDIQCVKNTLAKVQNDTYKPICLEPHGKGITITFGYNTKSEDHYGLMMYHKNRLIKAYERVPCQRKANSRGAKVIGVLECNYLKPTHNKQDFENSEEYRKTMMSVGKKLEKYWEQSDRSSVHTEPFEDTVKGPAQRRLQCNDCLKFRKIPDYMHDKKLPEKWICSMNPDPQFRSCTVEEEPKDSDDDEPPIHQKNSRQQEGNQKLQQETREKQSHISPKSSIQMTPKPSGETSAGTTPKRKKNARSQETQMTKKARRKESEEEDNCSEPSNRTLKQHTGPTLCADSGVCSSASDANKDIEYKDIKAALKDDGDDVKKGRSNRITKDNLEDQQNYKVLFLQAMEEINQLQHKLMQVKQEVKEEVDGLKDDKKYLEEVKRENEKDAAQDRSGSKRGHRDNNRQSHFLCSHAGQFHCKLTNLVFDMKRNGEVIYTVMSWDMSQMQGMGQFQPVGPLYNIDCPEGSIQYLHLPHCEINTEENQIELVVAQFSKGNIELLKPLKVTDTHVIIEVQHLSLYGLLKKWISKETLISAQVLFFCQSIPERRKLYIHLLPGNVPVKEVQNQYEGSTYLRYSSVCKLTPGKTYRPRCVPYVSQPETETFGYVYGPNYHPTFEVILNTEVKDITVSLLDEFGQEVWRPCQIFPTVPVEMDEGAEFVDKHRDQLIQRVCSVMENQANVKAEFYNVLKEKQNPLVIDLKSNP